MTKRLIALFLVCILAIPILAFPASATSTQEVTLSDADIGFFDAWYSYIDEGIGVCADYLSQLLYQVKSFVTVTVPAWTSKFNEFVTQEFEQGLHDELGEWLGTMGADINDWFQSLYNWQELIYNKINTGFNNLIGVYLASIKTNISACKSYLQQLASPDSGEADDFNNQISTEATEFDEAVDNMTEATLPDYESIDTDFNDYLYSDGFANVSGFYSVFFSGTTLYYVLMLAVTFALLSYSLFGKR